MKRLSNEEHINRINSYGKVKFLSCSDEKIKSTSTVTVTCERGHIWNASVAQLEHSKTGCQMCSGVSKKGETYVINEISKMKDVELICFVGGSYNNIKGKVKCRCKKCNSISDVIIDNLIRRGSFCKICAGNHQFSKNEYIDKINNARKYISFVKFHSNDVNQKSRVTLSCECGHTWETSVQQAVRGRAGCKKCSKCYQFDYKDREEQISTIKTINFIKWVDKRSRCTVDSRFIAECVNCEKQWEISIDNAMRGKSCPSCAGYGFNSCLDGYVYLLKSECNKMLKVGISNYPERRFNQLSNKTPFGFSVLCKLKTSGSTCREIELSMHKKYESCNLSGFDGATEWLKYDESIIHDLIKLGAR